MPAFPIPKVINSLQYFPPQSMFVSLQINNSLEGGLVSHVVYATASCLLQRNTKRSKCRRYPTTESKVGAHGAARQHHNRYAEPPRQAGLRADKSNPSQDGRFLVFCWPGFYLSKPRGSHNVLSLFFSTEANVKARWFSSLPPMF